MKEHSRYSLNIILRQYIEVVKRKTPEMNLFVLVFVARSRSSWGSPNRLLHFSSLPSHARKFNTKWKDALLIDE